MEGNTEAANDKPLDSYSRGGSINSVSADTYKYVNIPNEPADLADKDSKEQYGGYLLEFELDERYPDEISGFVSAKRQQVVLKAPEYASKKQVKYIKDYFQEMEDAVYSNDGYNKQGKYYTEYIDLKSAAQMYIVEELSLDNDAVATSFYMYKDVDDIFHFGPIWDFDWAFGGYNKATCTNTSYLQLNDKKIYNTTDRNAPSYLTIMGELIKHDDFMEMVAKVWNEEFYPLLQVSTGSKSAYTDNVMSIQNYGNMVKASANMNFNRFKFLGTTYWGSMYTGSTFTENVNYLDTFVNKRVAFLNSYINALDQKTTVYFDNSNAKWSDVYAYVWNNTTDAKIVSEAK